MSAGKRYKFQGSAIAIVSGYDFLSPSLAITGVTKANPAVVTCAAHPLASGDVVKFSNVGGMTDLNGEVYIVEKIDANSFSLVDTDSTGYNAYTSGGVIDVATFSNWCELTSYNRQGGSKPEIAATSLCSTAAEYELGLQDFGTTQIDFHFAPQTAIQTALAAFNASNEKIAVKVTLPKNGGIRTLLAFVQQVSEQVAVNGLWTASMTLRNTGAPYDQAG